MTADDDQLISEFLAPLKDVSVEDGGFSARVMEKVALVAERQEAVLLAETDKKERRSRVLSRLWTLLCIAAGLLLFVAGHGWTILRDSFLGLVAGVSPGELLLRLFVCMAVPGLLAIMELLGQERLLRV